MEGQSFSFEKMLMTIALIGVVGVFVHLYKALVREPERLRAELRKQGITGPPPNFLLGNIFEIKKSWSAAAAKAATRSSSHPISHNIGAIIFPLFDQWRKDYGRLFLFSLGNTQIVYVNQPEVVKEMTTCVSLELGKPTYQQRELGALLGQAISTSNGSVWAHQRKILAPEFSTVKVKGMIELVAECAASMIDTWKSRIEEGGVADINVDGHMRSFSGDVISRACFGSNYAQGEEIFLKLRALQKATSSKLFLTAIPGMRYLPIKSNRETWALKKEVKSLVLKVVEEREGAGHGINDLLQMVLEGAKASEHFSKEEKERFIVDNCKSIYLAGYETTAAAATWSLMLLSSNPKWQDLVRAEVLQVCQGQIPDANMLRKMKKLQMVINESLRLYPPVPVFSREALKDMKFGNLHVPKGVNLWSLVLTTHTDPEIWGSDSFEFNPARFANGIMGACKLPHMYMPFGVGPRVCLGQNLAQVELKILLALVLSNFSFTLSPNYVHSPVVRLVVEPEHGVNLLVKKL